MYFLVDPDIFGPMNDFDYVERLVVLLVGNR